jgi:drug/metabolite transporter (DMT)-like permease
MPPLGVLFGWLLLGERLEPVDLLGVLPVAFGIYLVTRTGSDTKRVQPVVALSRSAPR